MNSLRYPVGALGCSFNVVCHRSKFQTDTARVTQAFTALSSRQTQPGLGYAGFPSLLKDSGPSRLGLKLGRCDDAMLPSGSLVALVSAYCDSDTRRVLVTVTNLVEAGLGQVPSPAW